MFCVRILYVIKPNINENNKHVNKLSLSFIYFCVTSFYKIGKRDLHDLALMAYHLFPKYKNTKL